MHFYVDAQIFRLFAINITITLKQRNFLNLVREENLSIGRTETEKEHKEHKEHTDEISEHYPLITPRVIKCWLCI